MLSTEQRSHERFAGRWFWRYASPASFYPLAGRIERLCWALAAVLAVLGLYLGLFRAPSDFQQGEVYRIIYIHVPAAWMAMIIYLAMAFWSAVGFVLGTRLSFMMSHALAPTGAIMAFLALWTGALWGRPTWGTYWVWDARLTSTLILFFLYLGYLALVAAFDDRRKGDRAAGLIAIVGAVNVPIIYFSVQWWNTLHQGASVRPGGSSMATIMLSAMLIMTFAFWAYSIAAAMRRVRTLIIEREAGAAWLGQALAAEGRKR
ncbi:MAG: heme ABC transporter permease CcmC [Casimicrobiaceae bacterium]|nr:heme ABC transporter permease CcmC [Casimicrobiaceae bacterium]MDW8311170.1 heme ABC transporter permease CcmC [Burkholderiales bacterium]